MALFRPWTPVPFVGASGHPRRTRSESRPAQWRLRSPIRRSTRARGIRRLLAALAYSRPEALQRRRLRFPRAYRCRYSVSVSVDLPINRLKKLNMVCSGGGGAFYRCRRNRVPASNEHKTQTTRKRRGGDGCRAAKNRRKQREEPGRCAQKKRKTRILSAGTDCMSAPRRRTPASGAAGLW